jgi:DnaJ-class molecular chaperone
MPEDFYLILGVSVSASRDDIKSAFRELALKYHPDKDSGVGAEERFKKINEAYAVLSDSVKRKEYDSLGVNIFTQTHSMDDILREFYKNFNIESVFSSLANNTDTLIKTKGTTTDSNDRRLGAGVEIVLDIALLVGYFYWKGKKKPE